MAPRLIADVAAIGVSLLCIVHCLATPVLLALAPWLVPGLFEDERFHMIAVLVALPVSAVALAGTLRARPEIVAAAAGGLALLLVATSLHDAWMETSMTVSGAILVVFAHVRNLQLRAHA